MSNDSTFTEICLLLGSNCPINVCIRDKQLNTTYFETTNQHLFLLSEACTALNLLHPGSVATYIPQQQKFKLRSPINNAFRWYISAKGLYFMIINSRKPELRALRNYLLDVSFDRATCIPDNARAILQDSGHFSVLDQAVLLDDTRNAMSNNRRPCTVIEIAKSLSLPRTDVPRTSLGKEVSKAYKIQFNREPETQRCLVHNDFRMVKAYVTDEDYEFACNVIRNILCPEAASALSITNYFSLEN